MGVGFVGREGEEGEEYVASGAAHAGLTPRTSRVPVLFPSGGGTTSAVTSVNPARRSSSAQVPGSWSHRFTKTGSAPFPGGCIRDACGP